MVNGRQTAEWARAAELLQLTANCHRNPETKKTPFTSREFNLWERRFELSKPKQKPPKVPITVLKCFLKGGK